MAFARAAARGGWEDQFDIRARVDLLMTGNADRPASRCALKA